VHDERSTTSDPALEPLPTGAGYVAAKTDVAGKPTIAATVQSTKKRLATPSGVSAAGCVAFVATLTPTLLKLSKFHGAAAGVGAFAPQA